MRRPQTLKEWFGTITGAFAVIAGVMGFYFHLHTDVEAASEHANLEKDYQQQIIELRKENQAVTEALLDSVNRSEILRMQREIDRLTLDNQDPNISAAEKAQNTLNIKKYNSIIICIRTGQKYCV